VSKKSGGSNDSNTIDTATTNTKRPQRTKALGGGARPCIGDRRR